MKKYIISFLAAAFITGGLRSISASASVSGWTSENGRRYYFDEDGNKITGTYEIDGVTYVFAPNGVQKLGWQVAEDGELFYYDYETGGSIFGWADIDGHRHYIDPEKGKLTGISDISDSIYAFDEFGVVRENQFITENGSIYYAGEDGQLYIGKRSVGGVPYVFTSQGILRLGWQNIDDKMYYYDYETGMSVFGRLAYNGRHYYITPENGKETGRIIHNGIPYFYSEEHGYMETGWKTDGGVMRYYFEDGTAAVGLVKIENSRYYFSIQGEMLTGWQTVGGFSYYLGADGAVRTGWQDIEGKRYYFGSDGAVRTGWQDIVGKRYYFGSDGEVRKGLQNIEGKLYYFDSNGVMQKGWKTVGGEQYYLGNDGAAATGLVTVEGKKYYFSANGILQKGFQTIDGKTYHFNESTGVMSVNTTVGDYLIGADGVAVLQTAVMKRANGVIAQIGKSADAIFSYVRSNNKYKYIEATRPYEEIETIGWSYFANYAFDNYFVVCYHFAAVTDLLFKQAGFESRIIYGTGTGTGDHYWNQIKVNGVWVNYDTCNGFANVSDEYLKSKTYTWKKEIYPVYK